MKKIFLFSLISLFSISSTFATVEDDSIIKELNKENTKEISAESLKFKTFKTCEDLEKVTNDFLKNYNSKYNR
jgi:hypothetical protein